MQLSDDYIIICKVFYFGSEHKSMFAQENRKMNHLFNIAKFKG